MRKRQVKRILDMPPGDGVLPVLVVLSVSFLLGSLGGCLLAGSLSGDGTETLAAYIYNYLGAAQEGMTQLPGLLPAVWETVRWPLVTLLLGFSALGCLGLPVLFAVRGFLLAFTVSSFVRMFGAEGAALAFLLVGLTSLLALPVLFVMGVQSLQTALSLLDRILNKNKRPLVYRRFNLFQWGVCAGVLALCVLLEYIAVPALVGALAHSLLG